MNISHIRKAAEEFGIPFKVAAWTRCRYLRDRLRQNADDLKRFEEFANSGAAWDDETVSIHMRLMDLDELISTAKELQVLTRLVNGHERKERITDEQIETAKATPVNAVVEFRKGKATAWCHEDHNPSMYHGTRKNVAVCPVCDRKFNPIDVLMDRDGLSFVDAVLQLAA